MLLSTLTVFSAGIKKEVTVAIIKPDVVAAGKVDDVIAEVKDTFVSGARDQVSRGPRGDWAYPTLKNIKVLQRMQPRPLRSLHKQVLRF